LCASLPAACWIRNEVLSILGTGGMAEVYRASWSDNHFAR
jgi:hypothetical protein